MSNPKNEWYFAKEGRRFGPLSAASIKEQADNGQILPTDLVWKSGMKEWVEAHEIQGLFGAHPDSIPPPLPDAQQVNLPRFTVWNQIVFCETILPSYTPIKITTVAIHGHFLGQAQLKTLDDVKKKLAVQVKASGGNCVTRFEYGQKSNWRTTLMGLDNVSWYGNGEIGRISEELYRQMVGS